MSAAVLVLWVEQVKHQGKGGETCSLVSIAIGRGAGCRCRVVFLVVARCFEDSKRIGPFVTIDPLPGFSLPCSSYSVRRDGPFSQMDLVVTGFETFLIGPICDIAATLLFALDSSTTTTTNGTAWAGLAQAVGKLKTTPSPDSPTRQFIVAWSVLTIGAFFFYFFFSGLNYYVVHRKCGNLKHKPFAGQVGAEIAMASRGNLLCMFISPFSLFSLFSLRSH